jgi:lysophospholipase L1-like esterase
MKRIHLLLLAASAAGFSARADTASWKFSFGPGPAPAGYVAVPPTAVYSDAAGYGFEPGSAVSVVDRGGTDPLQAGYATGTAPFYFSVALPEGNYRVTVGLGDASAETVTTVKAEVRRLVLERVRTAPGEFATRTFTVAIRRPEYPGGIVRLKPREKTTDVWDWDNRLTLEFCDEKPSLRFLEIEPAKDLPTFFLVGDSTMCDQSREPFNSWGQMITRWFGPGIVVSNHAESGESTRSYLGERRWPKVMSLIRPGDYLCVQLGHNDEHEKGVTAFGSYQKILEQMVTDTRAHGATPILVTPMYRRNFDASGHVVNDHGDFPEAVRRVARELNVPLVDLNAMSKVLYETLGPADTIAVFATMNGKTDTTHQSDYGSYELAQCVVRGIRESVPALAQYLLPDTPAFDPAHPDPISSFAVPKETLMATERPYGH